MINDKCLMINTPKSPEGDFSPPLGGGGKKKRITHFLFGLYAFESYQRTDYIAR